MLRWNISLVCLPGLTSPHLSYLTTCLRFESMKNKVEHWNISDGISWRDSINKHKGDRICSIIFYHSIAFWPNSKEMSASQRAFHYLWIRTGLLYQVPCYKSYSVLKLFHEAQLENWKLARIILQNNPPVFPFSVKPNSRPTFWNI